MKDIILDKITLAQNSLYENREEFINLFFKDGGYIESYIENCESPCIFGIINFTGDFQLLGTYKKIYTA